MACKKPVIMVIDGVSRALVEEAQCGVYAEPENVPEIVQKMLQLSQDKSKSDQFGEQGYRFAKKYFDRHVLADQYIKEIKRRLNRV